MTHVVITFREPVTLSTAAEAIGREFDMTPTAAREVVRDLWRRRKVLAKACDVETKALLFELWEVEAAVANRGRYVRRVAAG